jgi:hypothetical protein
MCGKRVLFAGTSGEFTGWRRYAPVLSSSAIGLFQDTSIGEDVPLMGVHRLLLPAGAVDCNAKAFRSLFTIAGLKTCNREKIATMKKSRKKVESVLGDGCGENGL